MGSLGYLTATCPSRNRGVKPDGSGKTSACSGSTQQRRFTHVTAAHCDAVKWGESTSSAELTMSLVLCNGVHGLLAARLEGNGFASHGTIFMVS